MNNIERIKISLGSWEKTAKLLFDILATQPNQESITTNIKDRLPKKQEKKASGRKSRTKASVKHGLANIGLISRDGMEVSNNDAAKYVIERTEEYLGYSPTDETTKKNDVRTLAKRISDADPKRKVGTART